ncbi:hypothetical protein C8J57DRAFT_1652019 [Mycena rebaudengoi]|nr:hypothetical protein C8J57DRAFT_1652019 [Mycena rebaudengoi]
MQEDGSSGLKLTLGIPRTAPTFVDLDLGRLAFDSDDEGSGSGSDSDGYVSVLQRARAQLSPRRIAGTRRVSRAVSSPQPIAVVSPPKMQAPPTAPVAFMRLDPQTPAYEVFQSITPGYGSTSFEELRVETYLQSLVATGTARPEPASSRADVFLPRFTPQFVGAAFLLPPSFAQPSSPGTIDPDFDMTDDTPI